MITFEHIYYKAYMRKTCVPFTKEENLTVFRIHRLVLKLIKLYFHAGSRGLYCV